MAKEERSNHVIVLKAMFETGAIKKMKDIEKLFPTTIARALKLNHSRYIQKLYKPEEFTLKQVFALAKLVDINPQIIIDVIITQYKNAYKK